jgi:periplasmic protein TonB
MELTDKNNKRKTISVIASLLLHAILILILFGVGLKYPDPPPKERGVEMDLGNLLDTGNALAGEAGGSDASNPIHDMSEGDENMVSQDVEDVPLVAKKTNKSNKEAIKDVSKSEETINPNALFKKGKVKNTGSGEGNGTGAGKGNGNNGGGGTGSDATGSGTSFSLAGRASKSLGIPPSKTDEVGSIVVTIWVNQEGQVARAVAGARGTTIDNRSLWRHCESAASRSKFSANPNAPEEQKGTITYKFRR